MNFVNKKNFSIYIFFGSQTGYAESIALYLKKKIITQVKSITIHIDTLNNFLNYTITKDEFTIFILSTTGDGEFPDNSNILYKTLRKNKEIDLGHIHYCLLGLGDSNYNSFCHASKILDRLLKRKNATKFLDTCFNDESIQSNETIDKWMMDVIIYLKDYKITLWNWFVQSMTSPI